MNYYIIGQDKSFKNIAEILAEYQPVITSGTEAPTGGNDGDIYIQYEE